MSDRVVEQVAHDPFELASAAVHPAGRHSVGQDRRPIGESADLVEHDVVEVDDGVGQRLGRLVEPRQLEQLVDHVLEPLVVGEDPPCDVGPVGIGPAPLCDLDRRSDRRDRAAQLVRRVGHESSLPLGRVLEPLQHRVHGARQLVDLVTGARLRDALIHARTADRRRARFASRRRAAVPDRRATTRAARPRAPAPGCSATTPARARRRCDSPLRAGSPRRA